MNSENISSLLSWQLLFLVALLVAGAVFLVSNAYILRRMGQCSQDFSKLFGLLADRDSGTRSITDSQYEEVQRQLRLISESMEHFSRKLGLMDSALESLKCIRQALDDERRDLPAILAKVNDSNLRLTLETIDSRIDEMASRISSSTDTFEETLPPFPEAVEGNTRLDPLWPQLFSEGQPLHPFRKPIEQGIHNEDKLAATLFLAIANLELVLNEQDSTRSDVARHVHGMSLALHHWQRSEEQDNSNPDNSLNLWLDAFQARVRELHPSLTLKTVYPGAPFDADIMARDHRLSGNQPTVKSVLSWAVLETFEDQKRILQRATVVTP